jgi:hypothetical protein
MTLGALFFKDMKARDAAQALTTRLQRTAGKMTHEVDKMDRMAAACVL